MKLHISVHKHHLLHEFAFRPPAVKNKVKIEFERFFGVTTLQTLFLIRLSQNVTHMFTNVISCRSSHFDLLQSKNRSTLNLTDLLFLIRLSRNFTHVFTNFISCMRPRFDFLQSKTRSKSNLTDFLYHSTDLISYPIVTKLQTRVHKHHLLYELAFRPSAVKN